LRIYEVDMKRALVLAVPSLALVLLVACGRPGNIAVKYLSSRMNQDSSAWDLLCKADQTYMPKDQFIKDQGEFSGLTKTIASKTTYKLVSVEEKGATAIAKVDVTGPNPMAMVGVAFQALLAHKSEQDTAKAMKEAQNGNTSMVTRTETVALVKESGAWKVREGFADQEKAKDLLEKANKAKDQGALDTADDLADQALALQPSSQEAQALKAEMDKALPAWKEAKAYIPKLVLDTQRVVNDSGFMGPIKGAKGEIKNTGDKTVLTARGRITFFDFEGKPCFDDSVLFFKAGLSTLMSTDQPLKPNYTQKWISYPNGVPSTWDGKTVKVEITSIELEN
jgi:hypothetical protein